MLLHPSLSTGPYIRSISIVEAGKWQKPDGSDAKEVGEFPAATASLIEAARPLPQAAILLVRQGERVGIAAGNTIIEGVAGLNIGLMLPELRQIAQIAAPTATTPGPFSDMGRRVRWDLAKRLSALRFPRTITVRLGRLEVRLNVGIEGMTFLDGAHTIDEFVGLIAGAVSGAERIAYTISDPAPQVGEAPVPVLDLVGPAAQPDQPLRFGADGWPDLRSRGAAFPTLSALVVLAQRLQAKALGPDPSFQLLDMTARTILSGRLETGGVTMKPATEWGRDV